MRSTRIRTCQLPKPTSYRHRHRYTSPLPAGSRILSQYRAMIRPKGFMHITALFSIICSAGLGFSATIPSAQSINSSPIDLVSANTTSLGAQIDPRFTISSDFSDEPIVQNDCLIIAITMMGLLSARDFTSRMGPDMFGLDRYPSVIIFTQNSPLGTQPEVRFVLWGFYLCLRSMLRDDNWKVPSVTLLWDGRSAGRIEFANVPPFPPLQGANSSGPLTQRSANPSNLILSPFNTTQSVSQGLGVSRSVRPTSYGAAISKISIFMAVLESYLYIAPKPGHAIITPFSVSPIPYNVVLRMRPVLREPPFFTYRDAALGLSIVPELLISERHEDWTETAFDYRVNDKLVGSGEIVRL